MVERERIRATWRISEAYTRRRAELGAERAGRLHELLLARALGKRSPGGWLTWALEQDPFRVLSDSEIEAMHGKKRAPARSVGSIASIGEITREITSRLA